MLKKKSILSYILAICLILPAIAILTACSDDTIDKLDGTNNIFVEGEFEKGSSLSSNKVEETSESYSQLISKISDKEYNSEKVAVFNISILNKEGEKTQPKTKVKITIKKPFESENGFTTFHIKSDETVESLTTTENGGNLIFETTSFSYFVVVGKVPPTNPPSQEEQVTALQLSYQSAGFIDGVATYTIGDTNKPKPNEVVVYGVTANGNILLTKDTDYTVDLDSLNFEQEGTYTIIYTYIKNFEIKATLTINVVAGSQVATPVITFTNTHADSLEHLYNGTAVFVSKEDIFVDGTKLSEITDEEILNKITCSWRDKNTKVTSILDKDITLTGEINTQYGVNRDITIGNEIAGPCVVGEYEFVLYYNGTEKLVVEATITESSFQKITEVSDFDATTAPTIFGEICYYTIVGYANGQMYVMQMPADASSITSDVVEAQARLVTMQGDGSLVLGGKFDFVFTPMRYFDSEWKYYPESSTDREDLLVDFCTGFYGARTATIGLATPVINRIGWTSLSGDKIARYKEEISAYNTTYGNLAKFAEDGAVTIYAPRKGETENNALRLVKNADGSFVFTGIDKTTDTRESYPIYVYKQYVKKADVFDFYGKLDKQYDGNAVQFNAYKDFYMEIESGEDVGGMLKMGTIKFVFKDLKDNVVMEGSVQDDGTVTGPSAIGQYKLVVQFFEKGEKGQEWVDKSVLTEFQIYPAS